MTKEKINQNEGFRSLKLQIEPPDPIQGGWKISFTCEDAALCAAYNVATKKVLDEHRLMPFHMWEIWKKTNEETLALLLQMIEK